MLWCVLLRVSVLRPATTEIWTRKADDRKLFLLLYNNAINTIAAGTYHCIEIKGAPIVLEGSEGLGYTITSLIVQSSTPRIS